MSDQEKIQMANRLEANARLLLKDAATLREELSGGSDSSISKPVLSMSQIDQLIKRRRKSQLK